MPYFFFQKKTFFWRSSGCPRRYPWRTFLEIFVEIYPWKKKRFLEISKGNLPLQKILAQISPANPGNVAGKRRGDPKRLKKSDFWYISAIFGPFWEDFLPRTPSPRAWLSQYTPHETLWTHLGNVHFQRILPICEMLCALTGRPTPPWIENLGLCEKNKFSKFLFEISTEIYPCKKEILGRNLPLQQRNVGQG